ncbi:MAG: flavin reductase [Oscillospiraceae bacterium]|nr:flavin reductase [Oscillospiraceae bacterium]
MDIQAFFKLSYGLYIVSGSFEEKQSGCIANTLIQVTAMPEKLSVTLSKENFTTKLIEESKHFNATVITQNASMNTIAKFGFRSGKNVDKFEGFEVKTDDFGTKYVVKEMASMFSCKVISTHDVGTHITFIGEVEQAEILSDEPVMTYDYYYQVKKGKTPKNAPSYKEEKAKKGYKCSICGYVHEEATLPDDFVCPVCKKGREVFQKV